MGFQKGKELKAYLKKITKEQLFLEHSLPWDCLIDFSAVYWRQVTGTLAHLNDADDAENGEIEEETVGIEEQTAIPTVFNYNLLGHIIMTYHDKLNKLCGDIQFRSINVVCDCAKPVHPKIFRRPIGVMTDGNFAKVKAMESLSVDFVASIVIFTDESAYEFLRELHGSIVSQFIQNGAITIEALMEVFHVERKEAWVALLRPCGFLSVKYIRTLTADVATMPYLAKFMSPAESVREDGTSVIENKDIWGRLIKDTRFRYHVMNQMQAVYTNLIVNGRFNAPVSLHGLEKKYRVNANGTVSKLQEGEMLEADTILGKAMRASFMANVLVVSPDADMIFQAFKHFGHFGNRHIYWLPKISESIFYDFASPLLKIEERVQIFVTAALLGNDFIYSPVGGNFEDALARLREAATSEGILLWEAIQQKESFVRFLTKFMAENTSKRKGKRMVDGELVPFTDAATIFDILRDS
jgi:hypothetical protein